MNPRQPVVDEASGPEWLRLSARCASIDRQALFEHWIRPDLLALWWPPEAEVEARVGGAYHLWWPAMEWHLRGTITRYDPGRELGFTWWWEHDPHRPRTEVVVRFAPDEAGGSRIELEHGPYPPGESGMAMRQENLDGWMYFLPRLASPRT